MRILLFSSVFFFNACLVLAAGNLSNESFSAAKKMLASQVYHDHSVTLYCGAVYDSGGEITLPEGFSVAAHAAWAAFFRNGDKGILRASKVSSSTGADAVRKKSTAITASCRLICITCTRP